MILWLYLIVYHYISLYLMISHDISLYLIISHDISWYLMIFHYISLYLIVSHDISWYLIIYHYISWYLIISHYLKVTWVFFAGYISLANSRHFFSAAFWIRRGGPSTPRSRTYETSVTWDQVQQQVPWDPRDLMRNADGKAGWISITINDHINIPKSCLIIFFYIWYLN